MNTDTEITPIADVYDSVLNAIGMGYRRPRHIAKALAYHPQLSHLPYLARLFAVDRALEKLRRDLYADQRGFRMRWYLLRRGVSRLDSPVNACCGVRGICTCQH